MPTDYGANFKEALQNIADNETEIWVVLATSAGTTNRLYGTVDLVWSDYVSMTIASLPTLIPYGAIAAIQLPTPIQE